MVESLNPGFFALQLPQNYPHQDPLTFAWQNPGLSSWPRVAFDRCVSAVLSSFPRFCTCVGSQLPASNTHVVLLTVALPDFLWDAPESLCLAWTWACHPVAPARTGLSSFMLPSSMPSVWPVLNISGLWIFFWLALHALNSSYHCLSPKFCSSVVSSL